jgi:hypothetical protein
VVGAGGCGDRSGSDRALLWAVVQGDENDVVAVFDEEDMAECWADRYNSAHSWSSDTDRAGIAGAIANHTGSGCIAAEQRVYVAQRGRSVHTRAVAVFDDEDHAGRWAGSNDARIAEETASFNPPLEMADTTAPPILLVRTPKDVRSWIGRFAEETFQYPQDAAGMLLGAMYDLMAVELRQMPLTVREADCLTDLLGGGGLRSGRGWLEIIRRRAAAGEFDVDDVWDALKIDGADDLGAVKPRLDLGPVAYVAAAHAFGCNQGEYSYGTVYGVNQEALLTKLRGLGPTADLALRFACMQMATVWPKEQRDYRKVGINIHNPAR